MGIIVWVVLAIIWGVVCNKIIENKGYYENWFWWGFFFGIFATIVALTKPENRTETYTYSNNGNIVTKSSNGAYMRNVGTNVYGDIKARERAREEELLNDGGWKCPKCKRVNSKYTGSCACGCTKNVISNVSTGQSIVQPTKEELKQNNEIENLEVLKKYKELYDLGAISEKEFLEKKEKLLASELIDRKENIDDNTALKKEWMCHNCGHGNEENRKSCSYCGAIKSTGTKVTQKQAKMEKALMDWTCPKCMNVNKCYIGMCKCGVPKSEVVK